jgi:hypothetical protein
MGVLVAINSVFTPMVTPMSVPGGYMFQTDIFTYASTTYNLSSPACNLFVCPQQGNLKIVVTPATSGNAALTSATTQMAAFLDMALTGLSNPQNNVNLANTIFTGFADEAAMEAYIAQPGYAMTPGAITVGKSTLGVYIVDEPALRQTPYLPPPLSMPL